MTENKQYLIVDSYNYNTYVYALACAWGGSVAYNALGSSSPALTLSGSSGVLTATVTGGHLFGIYQLN